MRCITKEPPPASNEPSKTAPPSVGLDGVGAVVSEQPANAKIRREEKSETEARGDLMVITSSFEETWATG
jgi:hypothetical protein